MAQRQHSPWWFIKRILMCGFCIWVVTTLLEMELPQFYFFDTFVNDVSLFVDISTDIGTTASTTTFIPIDTNIDTNHGDDTWHLNWTLILAQSNLTNNNVSEAIRWYNPSYKGYCGSQIYPMLSNASNFEYFWIHDAMTQANGTILWIFATDPSGYIKNRTKIQPKIFLGLYDSYMICAFNDGTTVISENIHFMRRKNLDFMIIICPIPIHLQSIVLNTDKYSTIGVTLFDSRVNRSDNVIFQTTNTNANTKEKIPIQWNNVTTSVCSSFVINNGLNIYHNDGYYRFPWIGNKSDELIADEIERIKNKTARHRHITKDQVPQSLLPTTYLEKIDVVERITMQAEFDKKYFLSACLIAHDSGDRYGQMNLRIDEWIHYGLAMGIEHFYIYEHLPFNENENENENEDENNSNGGSGKKTPSSKSSKYYSILEKYILDDIVTYIPWFQAFSKPWNFQVSFINSCLQRFRYENNYITVIDFDEYIIIPHNLTINDHADSANIAREKNSNDNDNENDNKQKIEMAVFDYTLADQLKHIINTKFHTNMFVLKCKLATTCPEDYGCDLKNNVFESFLQRHRCISKDNPPTNPKKYIINPSAIWYAFVHGIPRWKPKINNNAIFYDTGLCIHARDHHLPFTKFTHPYMQHFVKRFTQMYQAPNHDKVLPFLNNSLQYCDHSHKPS